MALQTRHVGNCQICEGGQKLRDGRLVHHGYKRPGHGNIVGDCPGVGEPPYEVSCDALIRYKTRIEHQLEGLKHRLADIKEGRVDRVTEHRYGGKVIEHVRGVADEYSFKHALRALQQDIEYRIRGVESEIKRAEHRIAAWKPQDVRTFEEEKRKADAGRAERKAARDAARAERDAKKAATKSKQDALKASRLAIRHGFEAKARELAAQPESPERQAAARELLAEMRKKKYSWMAWWELGAEDAFVALGLATVEGRNLSGRPYLRWSYHHAPPRKVASRQGLRRRYVRRGHAMMTPQPLVVMARDGATYESVMTDLGKLASSYGGKFSDAVTRAVTMGLVMVSWNGKWRGSGRWGHLRPEHGVRLGIDRDLG